MAAHFLKRLAALAALLLAAAACKYPYELNIPRGEYPLVIEGDILIGTSSRLKLSFAVPLDRDNYVPPTLSATGYIEGEDGTRIQGIDNGSASLLFDSVDLPEGQRYRLHVEAVSPAFGSEGGSAQRIFESDWLDVCPAPVIDNLSFDKNAIYGELDIALSMHCSGSSHFRWTYVEEWEYHSDIMSSYLYDPDTGTVYEAASPFYRCWSRAESPTINIFTTENQTEDRFEDLDFVRIPLTDRRLQVLYRITVQLGALSEEAFKYWRAIQETTYSQGSIFAPTPSQMSSNIHCISDPDYQVLGYLNAAAVTSARLYYDNTVHHYHQTPKGGYYYDPLEMQVLDNVDDNRLAYWSGYLPYEAVYEYEMSVDPSHYMWAVAACIDCRKSGGSTDKPDDWPQ
ncbi:MAG: DUF4249 domain-containing protein [Bacteroidales bacterium]|nr:DUF4249 domain-containing protein [Bacteroidales bacterium]